MKRNFTVRQGALDGGEGLLSVAQHRSFRRAAADLGVTPSAISQAIRTLEGRVGAALFIRTTRSVGLTEAGERFLARAKPAFEELVAASAVAREESIEATVTQSNIGDLSQIDVPTHFVVGEHDRLSTPEIMRQMADAVPDASFTIIPGAGHLSNIENPRAFNTATLAFMSRHRHLADDATR